MLGVLGQLGNGGGVDGREGMPTLQGLRSWGEVASHPFPSSSGVWSVPTGGGALVSSRRQVVGSGEAEGPPLPSIAQGLNVSLSPAALAAPDAACVGSPPLGV